MICCQLGGGFCVIGSKIMENCVFVSLGSKNEEFMILMLIFVCFLAFSG